MFLIPSPTFALSAGQFNPGEQKGNTRGEALNFLFRDIFYLPLGRQPATFSLKGLRSAVPLPCREPHALTSPECFGKIIYRNIKPVLLKLLLKGSECSLPINFHSFQSPWKSSKPSSQGIP